MATVIYKDLATSTHKRNRFEIPLLAAILGTKFPKEQSLVQKTAISRATQNRYYKLGYHRTFWFFGDPPTVFIRRHSLIWKFSTTLSVVYFNLRMGAVQCPSHLLDKIMFFHCFPLCMKIIIMQNAT